MRADAAPGGRPAAAAELRERLPGCTVGAAGPGDRHRRRARAATATPCAAARCCSTWAATGQSASADDLGVYGLLLGAAGGEDVARFVRRTVGPVLDYDRERGSELARTLLTWYACGGNLTRTAAELYVHVNTLYQRLDRVTSLLGEGWRTGDGALQAHLALQAHRALGGTRDGRQDEETRGQGRSSTAAEAVADVPSGCVAGRRRLRAVRHPERAHRGAARQRASTSSRR